MPVAEFIAVIIVAVVVAALGAARQERIDEGQDPDEKTGETWGIALKYIFLFLLVGGVLWFVANAIFAPSGPPELQDFQVPRHR